MKIYKTIETSGAANIPENSPMCSDYRNGKVVTAWNTYTSSGACSLRIRVGELLSTSINWGEDLIFKSWTDPTTAYEYVFYVIWLNDSKVLLHYGQSSANASLALFAVNGTTITEIVSGKDITQANTQFHVLHSVDDTNAYIFSFWTKSGGYYQQGMMRTINLSTGNITDGTIYEDSDAWGGVTAASLISSTKIWTNKYGTRSDFNKNYVNTVNVLTGEITWDSSPVSDIDTGWYYSYHTSLHSLGSNKYLKLTLRAYPNTAVFRTCTITDSYTKGVESHDLGDTATEEKSLYMTSATEGILVTGRDSFFEYSTVTVNGDNTVTLGEPVSLNDDGYNTFFALLQITYSNNYLNKKDQGKYRKSFYLPHMAYKDATHKYFGTLVFLVGGKWGHKINGVETPNKIYGINNGDSEDNYIMVQGIA